MAKGNGKHLNVEMREAIESGIVSGDSARKIARMIGVAPSTVTREVLANRTVREIKRHKGAKLSIRCARNKDCQRSGTACSSCSTGLTICKNCRTRSCIDTCSDFERVMCPATLSWPYVCPDYCKKRASCGYPKCSYSATAAHRTSQERLRDSRTGIDCTQQQLDAMCAIVAPLVRQGQSFESIWMTHGDELPIGLRSAYNYQEAGIFGIANIELPRKVRMRPRRKNQPKRRDRVDRTGREHADFLELPLEDQVRVVQGDSVCGFEHNAQDLLSIHLVASKCQLYLLKRHGDPQATVGLLDHLETTLGSPQAFEAMLGILLLDRGVEFDDWESMERSCLVEGARRCRVFYCDAMRSDQKGACERNHEQLRRILPKGRSDFDELTAYDVATITSHVNSYVGGGRAGMCPLRLAYPMLPQSLLDELGIQMVAPDDVILKPSLIEHAVEQ